MDENKAVEVPTIAKTPTLEEESAELVNLTHNNSEEGSSEGSSEGSPKTSPEMNPVVVLAETFDIEADTKEKKGGISSSLTTIFSVWNTMMGSSLLAIPWVFTKSGLITGIIVLFVMALVTWYTMFMVVKVGKANNTSDFVELCKLSLGQPGKWLAFLGSALILIGVSAILTILLSTNLYSITVGIAERVHSSTPINAILSNSSFSSSSLSAEFGNAAQSWTFPNIWYWNSTTSPIWIAILILPFLAIPTLSMVVKCSSFGLLGTFVVIIFILVSSGMKWAPSTPHTWGFDTKFCYVAAVLTMSFGVHNVVPQLVANAPSEKRGIRDVAIGFCLGALTYLVVGVFAYSAFGNAIPQSILDNFTRSDILAMVARAALVFQMISVLPLIVGILRTQIVGLVQGSEKASTASLPIRVAFAIVILVFTTLVAIFYPQVGNVIRFVGAGTGLINVFILPVAAHMSLLHKEKKLKIWNVAIHCAIGLIGVLVIVG